MRVLNDEELSNLVKIVGTDIAERLDHQLGMRLLWEKNARQLPDARRFRERRADHDRDRAEMIDAILKGRWGSEEKIKALADSDFSSHELFERFSNDVMMVEAAIAIRVIRDRRTRLEQLDGWMVQDHRHGLVDDVLAEWVHARSIHVENITISEGGSGPGAQLLEILKLLLDAFARKTGEKELSDRTICNWVREMKSEPFPRLKLAAERMGKN